MPHFKKITVCHGKSCGPAGAANLKKILEEEYQGQGVDIKEGECCGRCEHSCTIVVDDQPISDLSAHTIRKDFLNNPQQAIQDAKQKDEDARKALEKILGDDFLT